MKIQETTVRSKDQNQIPFHSVAYSDFQEHAGAKVNSQDIKHLSSLQERNHFTSFQNSKHRANFKNIKHLSNEDLHQNLLMLVSKEREVLSEILLHIQEVDVRRLYLKMAYANLFDYMTKHLGYSAGSAQRRIDAARLSREVPSVIQDLENGDLNLSQVGLLQKSLREVYANHGKRTKEGKLGRVSKETKTQILEGLKHKSFEESQVLVSKALNLEIRQAPKVIHQQDESVRFEVSLTKDQYQKLEEMRALLSHSLPNGSWDEVLTYVADKVIQHKVKTTSSLKRAVLKRDQCCQYQHKITGKICGSKWSLEVDHIKPRWVGGTDALDNLRALCGNHNREVYREQAGIRGVS